MSKTDVFFCRRAIVNHHAKTAAYHFLLLDDVKVSNEKHSLGPFLFDMNIKELAENKCIFMQGSIDELGSIPARNTENIVILLSCLTLTEADIDQILDARLQGYQFGIMDPDLIAFSSDWLNEFNFVLFTLDKYPVSELIRKIKSPSISKTDSISVLLQSI